MRILLKNPRLRAPKRMSFAFCVHHVAESGVAVNSNRYSLLFTRQ